MSVDVEQGSGFADLKGISFVAVLKSVYQRITRHHVALIAAGVAFYALLALFPAITALVAIGGLMLDPSQIVAQIDSLSSIMPKEVSDIIIGQAQAVAGSREGGLGLAAVVGIGLALYSASRGMGSLVEGLNVVYGVRETRGFFVLKAITLGLTALLVLGFIVAVSGTLGVPIALSVIPMLPGYEMLIIGISWLVMLTIAVTGLAIIYRYAPNREHANWEWITVGSVSACLIWIIASAGFAFYVGNFGSYNESFGSLAGAIVLLMWLWISAFVVMLGAELNAAIREQKRGDVRD